MGLSIVGRKKELKLLRSLYERDDPDFLAVYGRRRVGKTYLIRNFFIDLPCVYFEITGLKDGSLRAQIHLFTEKLDKVFSTHHSDNPPKNWLKAFRLLTECIEKIPKKEKIVLFFDELPWLSSQKSGFLQSLDYYWNSNWSSRKKLKLVVCGSAASWMLNNLIRAKGGLHNRLTATIPLRPFTLLETEEYLKERGIELNRRLILDLYMAIGGIPHYLNHVKKGRSSAQNINQMCFTKDGMLFEEFHALFASLFDDSPAHIELIRIIAGSRGGIDKIELLKKSKLTSSGGRFTARLNELEEAGFIASFIPQTRKKKGTVYRLIDEYTLFYLNWIEPVSNQLSLSLNSSNYWESKMQTQRWKTWSGYAFEAICFKHIEQIKRALGIHAIALEISSWRHIAQNKNGDGVQIDLLIDRADGIINLCEIKYCEGAFTITKNIAENLEKKRHIYKTIMNVPKTVLLTMITPNSIRENEHSRRLVADQVVLNDFYQE
jgi:hypothetical protein